MHFEWRCVIVEIGKLDQRTRQRTPGIYHAHRQDRSSRRAVRIRFGYDFQRQTDRLAYLLLRTRTEWSHLHDRFCTSAITFGAVRVHLMQPSSLLQCRCQPLNLEVIVESDGGKVRLRTVVRLQNQNVSARSAQPKVAVLRGLPKSKLFL